MTLGNFTKKSKSFEKIIEKEKQHHLKKVIINQKWNKAKASTLKSVFLGTRVFTKQKFRLT